MNFFFLLEIRGGNYKKKYGFCKKENKTRNKVLLIKKQQQQISEFETVKQKPIEGSTDTKQDFKSG